MANTVFRVHERILHQVLLVIGFLKFIIFRALFISCLLSNITCFVGMSSVLLSSCVVGSLFFWLFVTTVWI